LECGDPAPLSHIAERWPLSLVIAFWRYIQQHNSNGLTAKPSLRDK
jgi:hypothetical protein